MFSTFYHFDNLTEFSVQCFHARVKSFFSAKIMHCFPFWADKKHALGARVDSTSFALLLYWFKFKVSKKKSVRVYFLLDENFTFDRNCLKGKWKLKIGSWNSMIKVLVVFFFVILCYWQCCQYVRRNSIGFCSRRHWLLVMVVQQLCNYFHNLKLYCSLWSSN